MLTDKNKAALKQYSESDESLNEALERLFREAGYGFKELDLDVPLSRDAKYWAVFKALPAEESFTLNHVCRAKNIGTSKYRDCPVDKYEAPDGAGRRWVRSMLTTLKRKGLIKQIDTSEWKMTTAGWEVLSKSDSQERRPLVER